MFNFAFVPFEHYSFSDAMNVVITGLVVVFLILILLVIIFSLTGKAFAPKKKEKAAPIKENSAPEALSASASNGSDDKLSVVAAITAALNEYLGNGNFVIKKIRPAKIGKKASSPWSRDGKRQNTRPF